MNNIILYSNMKNGIVQDFCEVSKHQFYSDIEPGKTKMDSKWFLSVIEERDLKELHKAYIIKKIQNQFDEYLD
ncbi:hypothetical protein ACP6L2_03870 [Sphingobacterium lactis]|uniref:hypothetical protein n=1 Tax=Sphingobacterium lactis TaxID=797291 RepID=UPI003F7ECC76